MELKKIRCNHSTWRSRRAPKARGRGPRFGGPWPFEEALAAGPRRAGVGLVGKDETSFGESAAEGSARAARVGGASAAS